MVLEKERLERRLKTEIELFKMYSLFIIGIVTGISSIFLSKKYLEFEGMVLFSLGVAFFVIVIIFFAISFKRINKMHKL